MEFTAKQIAQFVNGQIEGNEDTTINSFSKIEEGKERSISFLSSEKYAHYLKDTKASIILVDKSIKLNGTANKDTTLIWVENVRDCIAKLLQLYSNALNPPKKGISEKASVSSTAKIGKNVWIADFAFIGDGVVIGDGCQIYPHAVICDGTSLGNNCKIYPNVTIYHSCKLGSRVTIHAGSVIGADGFGFAPNMKDDKYDKIPQIGIVTIEDDVEIGANTCVDRSTMGSTFIRRGVKLDNLVQIAHNDDIGENTVMSAQVGIAGSTKVGKWCMFGGQTGISGHITIGNHVLLGAQSGVPSSLKDNQMLIGTPPMEKLPYFKSQAIFRKLPDMYKKINDLSKELEELKLKLQEK